MPVDDIKEKETPPEKLAKFLENENLEIIPVPRLVQSQDTGWWNIVVDIRVAEKT